MERIGGGWVCYEFFPIGGGVDFNEAFRWSPSREVDGVHGGNIDRANGNDVDVFR